MEHGGRTTERSSSKPYCMELRIEHAKEAGAPEGAFDIELRDHERIGAKSTDGSGNAFLDLRQQRIPRLERSVDDFLNAFLGGHGCTIEEGQRFGEYLLDRLLADSNVRALWNESRKLRREAGRPLRLELNLPATEARAIADIPFELLADPDEENGFLFYRPDAMLVRTLRTRRTREDLKPRVAELSVERAVLVAWANPVVEGTKLIPAELLEAHERSTHKAAETMNFRVRLSCRNATRTSLEAALTRNDGVTIASLIAHGDPLGGAIWLHQEGYENDSKAKGTPVSARDLARMFRRGKVDVALLWTCYGGSFEENAGSIVAALLDPADGDLAAVVTSHGAIRAQGTEKIVARILRTLPEQAEGNFERAVSEGRAAGGENDLQWATYAYYARPQAGRSVLLGQTMEEAAETLRDPIPPVTGQIERAPEPKAYFRGRGDEIARGLASLEKGRLVTVTGMGGIGKTALALAIGREAMGAGALAFARGLWIGLDGVGSAEAVRAQIASAFGLDPERCKDNASLARQLGEVRALLVLDNAEDLLERDRLGLRALLETLLRDCVGLRLFVTSRERLGAFEAVEEQVLPLGKLTPEVARAVFLEVAGERLSEADRGSADLTALLEWLDGHAQSLVLVARQTLTLSLRSIRRRLDLLGAGAVHQDGYDMKGASAAQDEQMRRERLESSLNLSFMPLLEQPRLRGAAEMFAWLGYFPAGLPGALVPAVFGEEGEEQRAVLLRKCLVEESGRERRLELPGPVRDYARRRAEAMIGEERRGELLKTNLRALAEWLVALDGRLGKPGARAAMDLGMREAANLEALLDLLLKSEEAPTEDDAATLAAYVAWAFTRIALHAGVAGRALGPLVKTRKFVEPRSTGNPRALVLEALGDLHARTDRHKEAEDAYRQALKAYLAIEDRLGEANIQRALGELYRLTNYLSEAEIAYNQAFQIYLVIDNRLGQANTQQALGGLYVRTNRLAEAEIAYNQALRIFRDIDDHLGLANTQGGLGGLYVRTNRLPEAEIAYNQALRIFRDIDNHLGQASTQKFLGDLYVRIHRLPEAEVAYNQALQIFRDIDNHLGQANTQKSLGDLYVRTKRLPEAEDAYNQALQIFRDIDNLLCQANTLAGLGNLALARNEPIRGFGLHLEALALHIRIDNIPDVAAAHAYLGRAALAYGDSLRAAALLSEALKTFVRLEDSYSQMLTTRTLATIFKILGRQEDVNAAILIAWSHAVAIGDPFAQQMATAAGVPAPPPDILDAALAILSAALEACTREFQATGQDMYAPLTPKEP